MNAKRREDIRDLIENSKEVCVTSVGEDGYPYTKAMFTAKRDGMRVHYFSTNLSSATAGRFAKNPKACVYFCDGNGIRGLALLGDMEVCQDAYHKEMLWHEGDEKYYPQGVTDPDYIVYRFVAGRGYFWHMGKEEFSIEELA